MSHAVPLAINPLPWILDADGYHLERHRLQRAMTELRAVGYSALTVAVPEGMAVPEYREFLADAGFAPAPGYLAGAFQDPSRHAELVEKAKREAAVHAELGLDVAFIAQDSIAERRVHPARGYGRVDLHAVAAGLAAAAEAGAAEGVTYALHPHVGTAVEVESDVRFVLDATRGSALAFGPDTGHLAWAGVNVAEVMAAYADRIVALHVKDVDPVIVLAARDADDDYATAVRDRHLWIEPGRGAIDFDAVFAALPPHFGGWVVVEVDVPHLPTAQESSAVALQFLLGSASLVASTAPRP